MTRGKQTTALALAGAVALASGAYALGTQVNDGSAAAAKAAPTATPSGPPAGAGRGFFGGTRDHHEGCFGGGPRGVGAGFGDLADRLEVSQEKLRAALEDIAKDHRDDFATRLAEALKIDPAKARQALQQLRPRRPEKPRAPRAFAAALAKELGVSAAKVRAALVKRRDNPGTPDELAKDLGVSEEQLHDAFHAVFGRLRPHGPGRPGLGTLAHQLGVTRQQLEDAFDKLRAGRHELKDQFAQELAKRLGLDAAKVRQAVEQSRPFPPRRP